MLEHGQLKVMVESATDLTATAREKSEKCRDYYDGYQLTPEEVAALKKRRQPPIVINRIKRKIDAMVGIEQKGRTDPRALPRTPRDEQAADVVTKALVFVDDQTRFDAKKSQAFENMIVEGYGGVEIVVEQKRAGFEIVINRLRWEEIFFDPYSREKDFSDAAYKGCMKWMALDKALALYGEENREILEATVGSSLDGLTYDDRPFTMRNFQWGDPKQKRVRVAQMYYLSGNTWHYAIFTGAGQIYNEVSPYLDDEGKPICPIILMSAYVDRDNRRYGVVSDMIDPQDEVNKRRSKLLHQLNSRQTWGVKGAASVNHIKSEMAKPDGHIEIEQDALLAAGEARVSPFNIISNNDQIAGQAQLLQEAKNEIDAVGPNASLQGQLQGEQSGRAILAQQNAGLIELAPVYDSLREFSLGCYRQMWMRIKQYWTDERYIRVTDEMEAPQFVGLNVVRGYDPMTMQPQIENPVPMMDVDIQIEEAPDLVTLRQEEFEQLAQMAQQGIPIPPEMLIEASSIRNKAKVLEMMQQQKQEAMQAQAMQAQAMQQMEGAKVQATVQTAQAKATRDMAEAEQTTVETQAMQQNAALQALAARRALTGF